METLSEIAGQIRLIDQVAAEARLTRLMVRKIIHLHILARRGLSVSAVAKEMRLTTGTVQRLARKHGVRVGGYEPRGGYGPPIKLDFDRR